MFLNKAWLEFLDKAQTSDLSFSETESKQVTDFICVPVVNKFRNLTALTPAFT